MSNFFDDNRARLEAFSRVSKTVGGRADYVQGGGGNTSVKLDGSLMAIKASGFCLKDVEVDSAYAVLDYSALRTFYYGHEPSDFEDVEKEGSAMAKSVTKSIEGLKALRPSVEAGFHSVLDTFVAHSHSVYANLATCSTDCAAIAAEALKDAPYTFGVVPYTNPGARLTFSIRDELRRVTAETGRHPNVIFMQNHGVIAHSDDPDECLRIHKDVNDRIAKYFGVTGDSFPAVELKKTEGGLLELDMPLLREGIPSGAFPESYFLETPLYPDQMVFLIGSFAFGKGTPEADMCLADPDTGIVLFNMPESKAQVIAETLTAVTFIADLVRKNGKTLSTMGEAARAFIANWESEKYRKSLAGKK